MNKKRTISSVSSSDTNLGISKSAERRAKRASEERLTPVSRESLPKIYDWKQMDKLDAGDAFELVYGFKPDVNFEAYGETIDKANARKWWERSAAITQCVNSIGDKLTNAENSTCYICGFPIVKGDPTAECEHILPVYKACMYLTLYNDNYKDIIKKLNSGQKLTTREKMISDEITMEYAWAHRCCNQKKSDEDFIIYDVDRGAGKFKLNYTETTKILKNIVTALLNDTDGHCMEKSLKTQFRKLFNTPNNKKLIKDWIDDRINILGDPKGKVGTIINYLNKYKASVNFPMFTLINLCNAISAADMNDVYTTWAKIKGSAPIKEIPPVSQITKAIVITETTDDSNKFVKFDWGRQLDTTNIYSLYKEIFEIPMGIEFEVRRKDTNISKAIMGSLLDLNKTDSKIGNFFQNFYAIITYPNITNHQILFPEMSGKNYASNMVGQAFKILLLGRMILKINNSKILLLSNKTHVDFYNRFVTKYNEDIQKLMNIKNDYFNYYNINVSIVNPYYVFIIVFTRFLDEIDENLKTFFVNEIKNQDPEIKNLFEDDNLRNNYRQLSDLLLSPEDKINNKLSNIDYVLVEFFMDEAQYLKFYDTWNPDIKDQDITTSDQNIAVGATGLLNLLKTKTDSETDEITKIADAIGKGAIINEINKFCVDKNELCNQIIQNYILKKLPGQTFTDMNKALTNLDSSDLAEILLEINKQNLIKEIQNNFQQMGDTVISYLHIKNPDATINNMNLNEVLNSLSISELEEIIDSYNMIQNIYIKSGGKKYSKKITKKIFKKNNKKYTKKHKLYKK